jgi:L-amino acid N-acyltransferase YncA
VTDEQEDTVEGFPKTVTLKGQTITVRMMTPTDGPRLQAFAQQLSDHDLLFLRRDITKQATIDKWISNIQDGIMQTVLAEDKAQVLGYSSLYRNDFDWSRHVAELRVLVAQQARKLGLGRVLTREAFNVALTLGIEKIVARMTPDQTGARTVFEELGFRPEALLRNEVKDRAGKTHDILLMANDVATFLARGEAYGIPR